MYKINNDIYDITEMVTQLQQNHIDEETPETLAIGTFGYFADINAAQIQNSIIVASELGNELFPAKAKFENNIIAHSIIQNITDINATPALMNIVLGIEEEKLLNLMKNDSFTLDKDCPIYIENYEFHLQYDIIIDRVRLVNAEYVYTARYDMSIKNNISSIRNPYLNTPFIQIINTKKYIYFPCQLMQVSHDTIYKKVISSSVIENKTFEFEFGNQLADFMVCVNDKVNGMKYLTPIFEGIGVQNNLTDYCYYTFLDSTHIRVRFDSISYIPPINTEVTVYLKTTLGASGNFKYNKNFFTAIESSNYNYHNLTILIMPSSDSKDGIDKKSISELRKLLPKEALSRGNITNERDIENFFNMINIENSMVAIKKKVDNQFERTYYGYMLLKDDYGNVVPTNTIPLEIARTEFDTNENRKYVLRQGTPILYDGTYGRVLTNTTQEELQELIKNDKETFIYTLPYMLVVNGDPLYVSYYLGLMNEARYLNFDYINKDNALQFISTYIGWSRLYITNPDTYTLKMITYQNTNNDMKIIEENDKGEIITCNIKAIAVLYNEEDSDTPYRYQIGELTNYNFNIEDEDELLSTDDISANYNYQFEFYFKTNDEIDDHNKVKITNVYIPGTSDIAYGYFSQSFKMNIYVLVKNFDGEENGRHDLDQIVPGLEGWTVTNKYNVENGLDFYKDYSNIVRSTVTHHTDIERDHEDVKGFKIKSVPVIRYTYANSESNMQFLVSELNERKAYIEYAINLLENNFLIDFKLYNTYGPSEIYYIDSIGNRIISRVNMTFNFALRLLQNSDTITKDYILRDLKELIEDINEQEDLHIPNIITTITNTYRNSIEYFEFLGFNDLGPGIQHLYRIESGKVGEVPEFLTVHTMNDLTPDINIRLE